MIYRHYGSLLIRKQLKHAKEYKLLFFVSNIIVLIGDQLRWTVVVVADTEALNDVILIINLVVRKRRKR